MDRQQIFFSSILEMIRCLPALFFCLVPCAVIEAGQGMIAAGANAYRASDCPENTYGASGKVYGLVAAPCKPCPRNMMTDGLIRVNNSDACINPDGFGYASEGLCRCLVGRFSSASRKSPVADCYAGHLASSHLAMPPGCLCRSQPLPTWFLLPKG